MMKSLPVLPRQGLPGVVEPLRRAYSPEPAQPPTPLPDALKKRIDEAMARYEQPRAALLPALHAAQEHFGYISIGVEQSLAAHMNIPVVDIAEVVSFYTLFRRKPTGKYFIQMCRTTSCYLMGGEMIESHIERKLGIKPGETSADGRFTYETAECLCACEIAPMMSINGKYYGPLTPAKVDEILDGLE